MNGKPLARILVVDDEAALMRALCDTLRDQGYDTVGFSAAEEALGALRQGPFDLLLTDLTMPGMDGVALLVEARKVDPQLVGVLMTGMGTIETAVQAMQAGALDYVLKPFKVSAILPVLERALAVRRLRLENIELKDTVAIHELNLAIAYTLDANVLLDKIADAVLQQFDADEASIMLPDPGGQALRVAAVRGERRAALLGERVPIGQGVAGWVASRREPVVLDGETRDPRVAPLHPRGDIQSALSMPMVSRGRLVGVVNVNCLRRRNVFTPGRIKILGIFANAAAAGLEAARLHEEVLAANASLEQRVAERTRQLEEATRAKSTFLATMSHEIRTPMNGVLGMLELLARTRLDEEQKGMVEIVRGSGRSLLRIIDDILDLSKIEAGKLEVRPEPASVAAIVQRVAALYSGNAASKGLELKTAVDPRISPALSLDPVRVQQVLNNFVSNAVKFTERGSVEIAVERLERGDGAELLRFSVRDTGKGISPADLERLFQPFSQVADGSAGGSGGTGLGLSICRRLAAVMGGAVKAASQPGVGTTMTFTLRAPLADPAGVAQGEAEGDPDPIAGHEAERDSAGARPQDGARGALILVVDDHPVNRMVLERQVSTLGYAVEVAEDGATALARYSSTRFALVLTDCHMPGMDGYELARSIRRVEAERGIARVPIIACTASAMAGEAQACVAAGMDDYLAKPIQLKELGRKLGQWLPRPAKAASG